MQIFNSNELKKLYIPSKDSHKGQNGKLLIIGGSHLFHGASLWALKVASRIVDMVFYASTAENNAIVQKLKEEFRDGIVIPRQDIENYINEADCVLIGPGMVRTEEKMGETNYDLKSLTELSEIEHEGIQTYYITKYLFKKYPKKKYVVDGGALQMMESSWLLSYGVESAILTPHKQEFKRLFGENPKEEVIEAKAKENKCVIIVKGQEDIVCSKAKCIKVTGGNAGMTKGGTGDALAGLIAGLACKNDLFISTVTGSYINKKAGDRLYERVGPFFNTSDLVNEIPKAMKEVFIKTE